MKRKYICIRSINKIILLHIFNQNVKFSVPEDVEDEIVGCITFNEQFNNRYGPIHPAFYQGTLEDAMKEACNKPAKEVL